MAGNINRVIITGNLTRDPELSALPSGTSVCTLRVACNGRRKNAAGHWSAALRGNVGGAIKLAWGSKYFSRGHQLGQGAARHHMHPDVLLFQPFYETLAFDPQHGADNPGAGLIPRQSHDIP